MSEKSKPIPLPYPRVEKWTLETFDKIPRCKPLPDFLYKSCCCKKTVAMYEYLDEFACPYCGQNQLTKNLQSLPKATPTDLM